MKRLTIACILFVSTGFAFSQTAADLFKPGSVDFYWLGIDYSHVKIVGGYIQFFGSTDKGGAEIRDVYFPAWNGLILAEPKKYDVAGMIQQGSLKYDIDMITSINAKTSTDGMEATETPNYSESDIEKFVSQYNVSDKSGIGILFIAESLNKNGQVGIFHFVAIRNSDKAVLLQQRLTGKPSGFGLRNFWAGSVYDIIGSIKKTHYKAWKSKYAK
jgi:hypothetical protein